MAEQKNFSLLQLKLVLERMGKVDYTIQDSILFFNKDNITFGKVDNDKIYLLDNTGIFKYIDSNIFKTQDELFISAPKSYWAAANKLT